jgi:hypothetical protein
MIRCLQHEAGGNDRMGDPFDGCDGAGSQTIPFHYRCIHTSDTVKLQTAACPRIKYSALFENTNGMFHCGERGASPIEQMVADVQRVPQTCRLSGSHRAAACSSMNK